MVRHDDGHFCHAAGMLRYGGCTLCGNLRTSPRGGAITITSPMKRRVLVSVVVLAFLLPLTIGVFWYSSYSVGEHHTIAGKRWIVSISSGRGRVALSLADTDHASSLAMKPKPGWRHFRGSPEILADLDRGAPLDVFRVYRFGFGAWHAFEGTNVAWRNWGFILPYWFLVVTTAVLPVKWVARRYWPRHRSRHVCVKCGYDLRAHKEGDRCPECGTSVAA
jgi:hypothetical protein